MSITKISPSVVDFDDGITITVDDNSDTLTLTSTDADASVGPVLNLYRNSSSPADSDLVGEIKTVARNDNSQDVETFKIANYITDVSDGTEDAASFFYLMEGGSLRERIGLGSSATVINEDGVDVDFRVESDGNAKALVILGDKYGLGVGRDPENAYNGYTSIELGQQATLIANDAGDDLGLKVNTYLDSSGNWKRKETGVAAAFDMDGDQIKFFTAASGSADANITFAQKLRIDSDGIKFGTDTAAANALDDYEEGSYNPSLAGDQSGSFGSSASSDTLFYTKIGRVVTVQGYVSITSDSSANGNLKIGLPVTAATLTDDGDYAFGTAFVQNNGSTLGHNLYSFVQPGGFFYIYRIGDDGTGSYIDHGDVDANWQFGVGFSYIAA